MKQALLVALLLSFTTTYASILPNLYVVDMDSQTAKPTAVNLHDALRQVVNRLTPGEIETQNQVIEAQNPQPLIASIQSKPAQGHFRLHIRFKPKAIRELMTRAGLPLLETHRPLLHTWVLLYRSSGTFIGDPAEYPELFETLDRSFHEKGFSVLFHGPIHEDNDSTFTNKELFKLLDNFGDQPRNQAPLLDKLIQAKTPAAHLIFKLNIQEKKPQELQWRLIYLDPSHPDRFDLIHQHAERGLIGQPIAAELSRFLFEWHEQGMKAYGFLDKALNAPHPKLLVNIHNIVTAHEFYVVDTYLKTLPGVIRVSANSVTRDAVLYTLDLMISPTLLMNRLASHYPPLPNDPDDTILQYQFEP